MLLPDADAIAGAALERAAVAAPPTPLTSVLQLWRNLHVSETELDGEGVFVDLGPGAGEIILRKNKNPRRKRFTLAHEIGHFVLLEELRSRGQELSLWRSLEVEEWCNKFAAGLLLPKKWLLRYLGSLVLSDFIEGILRAPALFDVSNQAFRLRVAEVAPLSIFMLSYNGNEFRLKERFESSVTDLSWKPDFLSVIERHRSAQTWQQAIDEIGKTTLLVRWITKTAVEHRCMAVLMPDKCRGSLAA